METCPTCPQCGSTRVWKDGFRRNNSFSVQRFLCRDCGYRFSDTRMPQKLKNDEDEFKNGAHREGLTLLVEETGQKTEAGQREATMDVKSILFQYAWWLKKEGYAESTISTRTKILKILSKRGADLQNPDSVKEVISRQEWSNKRKVNAADAYTAFLRMKGE
ncbi:MAG: hypothetical protein QXG97_06670, partial [Nitrososphaerota archaeon]